MLVASLLAVVRADCIGAKVKKVASGAGLPGRPWQRNKSISSFISNNLYKTLQLRRLFRHPF
jgi:hypothetical protein